MRKLSQQSSLKRVITHAAFIQARLAPGMLLVVAILVPLHTYMLISMITYQASYPGVQAPSFILTSILTSSSMIFFFIIVYAAYMLAGELETGEAALYLSHPISKREYVASWLIVTLAVTSALYLVTIAVPVVVLDPRVFREEAIREVALAVMEMVICGTLTFMVALIKKNKGLTFFFGLVLYYIMPFFLTTIISFLSFVFQISLDRTQVMWALKLFYPYKSYLYRPYKPYSPGEDGLPLNLIFLVLLLIAISRYTKEVFEVK